MKSFMKLLSVLLIAVMLINTAIFAEDAELTADDAKTVIDLVRSFGPFSAEDISKYDLDGDKTLTSTDAALIIKNMIAPSLSYKHEKSWVFGDLQMTAGDVTGNTSYDGLTLMADSSSKMTVNTSDSAAVIKGKDADGKEITISKNYTASVDSKGSGKPNNGTRLFAFEVAGKDIVVGVAASSGSSGRNITVKYGSKELKEEASTSKSDATYKEFSIGTYTGPVYVYSDQSSILFYEINVKYNDSKKEILTPISDSPYSVQGFAAGGLSTFDWNGIKEWTTKQIDNPLDFVNEIKNLHPDDKKGTIIEVTADLDLGYNNIAKIAEERGFDLENDNKRFTSHSNTPLLHPTLMESGVGSFNLKEKKNLIIYSKTGNKIKHLNLLINDSQNVIIRNLTFCELWEWDDATLGHYDRNDWDFIEIQNSQNVWIDHCSFSKSYDGIVDSKNGSTGVSITWCRVDPNIDEGFINTQFEYLEKNIDTEYDEDDIPLTPANTASIASYSIEDDELASGSGISLYSDDIMTVAEPSKAPVSITSPKNIPCLGITSSAAADVVYKYPFYRFLRYGWNTKNSEGKYADFITSENIAKMATPQQKSHLVGAGNSEAGINSLEITLAHNYYINSRDRMPRLRGGNGYIYNCVIDSSNINASTVTSGITSAIATITAKSEATKNKYESFSISRTCQAFLPVVDSSMLVANTIVKGVSSGQIVKDNQASKDEDKAKESLTGKFKGVNIGVGSADSTYNWDSTVTDTNNPLYPTGGTTKRAFKWNTTTANYESLPAPADVKAADLTGLEADLEAHSGAGKVSLDWTKFTYPAETESE